MLSKAALLIIACCIVSAPVDAQTTVAADTAIPPAPASIEQPKPVLTTEMRGDIAMARKDYRQAIDLYRSIPGRNAILLNKLGIAYHQLTELKTAKKLYEDAIKVNPKYSEAINNLGTVFYAEKNFRRAISQYERALKITPFSASVYSNLGTALFARKRYDQALAAYSKAVELDPEVFERRGSHGVLLQERSVEERAKFHFYLSKTYAQAGRSELALQYMRKAIEEGFKERKRFVEDPEFASMQELPEFKELLAFQPRVL